MPLLNIVGSKVKKFRLANRPPITQAGLAIRLQILDWSIDRFGISKIERGKRRVTDQEVVFLAKALGLSVAKLLGEEE